MTNATPAVNPCGAEPPDPAPAFLAEVAELAGRRAALAAEHGAALAGPLALAEVLARRDLDRVDAELARLAADPRLALALAALVDRVHVLTRRAESLLTRVRALETAAAAGGAR